MQNLLKYKKEIINALNWYEKNKGSSNVIKENSSLIINAQDNILGTIAGTLASILSKSGSFEDGTLIMSMAYIDKNIKASLRVCGKDSEVDLREIVKEIVEKTGGEAGGHYGAAGAMVPIENEKEFIQIAKDVLGKISMEETIL